MNKKNQALDAFIAKKKKNIEQDKRDFLLIQEQSSEVEKRTNEAKFLEDEGNYDYAILAYESAIAISDKHGFHYHSKKLNIHRIIILLGKLKRHDKLKSFLANLINEYPDAREVKDWNNRLEKVNTKINNQNQTP